MIKNIVFDIGGVLADYRMQEFLLEKGIDPSYLKRILKASVMNPWWGRFERGEVTEAETMQAFIDADPEIEAQLRLAFTDLRGMLVSRDFTLPLVEGLKKEGYGVYYLSNYSKKAYDECGESLTFMPCMDGGLVSFLVGATKPSPEMYTKFLEEYHLDAGECLFVDDTEENVTAAEALGFTGLAFSGYEQLLADFERLGVNFAG